MHSSTSENRSKSAFSLLNPFNIWAWVAGLLLLFSGCGEPEKKEHAGLRPDTLHENNAHFRYEFAYPVLKGNQKVNEKIRGLVQEELANFRSNAYQWCNRRLDNPQVKTALDAEYEVISHTNQLFSVRWTIYVQWSGSDVPSLYFATLNVKPATGEVIDVQAFADKYFSSDSAAAAFLTNQIARRQDNPLEVSCNNIWETPHKLQDFAYINLKKDSVILTFDDFILGTYTCGTPEVAIPIESLSKNE